MTGYRATPEQWAQCEEWLQNPVIGASDACILELRARVEELEEDAGHDSTSMHSCLEAIVERLEKLEANAKPTPNSSQIGSSLVERVTKAVAPYVRPYRLKCFEPEARAAIREVAAWLREASSAGWTVDQALFNLGECTYEDMGFKAKSVIAELLEQEADQ